MLPQHFFRPPVERALRLFFAAVLIALIVLPMAWGFEQRRQARAWQDIACAYRMRELAYRAPIIARVEHGGDPCGALQRLGYAVELPR